MLFRKSKIAVPRSRPTENTAKPRGISVYFLRYRRAQAAIAGKKQLRAPARERNERCEKPCHLRKQSPDLLPMRAPQAQLPVVLVVGCHRELQEHAPTEILFNVLRLFQLHILRRDIKFQEYRLSLGRYTMRYILPSACSSPLRV